MLLEFESSGIIGSGTFPDFIQFEKTEGELFYLDSGRLMGTSTKKLHGIFDAPTWLDTNDVSPESDRIRTLEINTLSGFGIIGSYGTDKAHKLIIYEFQHDVSRYLHNGSIKHSVDHPVGSFTLSLENPEDTETEVIGNIAFNEQESLLRPGAKVIFEFTMGDSEEYYPLGSFYIDRGRYNVSDETATADGRNLIGKALMDQTLNEGSHTGVKTVTEILEGLLRIAHVPLDQFEVQKDYKEFGYIWDSNKTIYSAIEEVLRTMVNWRIEETDEGEILIGDPEYSLFQQKSVYTFSRNKDIFSRSIVMDDEGSYRKVCVHDKEKEVAVYRDVKTYTGWNLQNNKTLFVEVPTGTSTENAEAIAVDIAERLESVGRVETFSGPFRPHLLIGDQASIIEQSGKKELGLITEITHNFGKTGFTTTITVDSGGRLGRGRLSDYIRQLDNKRTQSGALYYNALPSE